MQTSAIVTAIVILLALDSLWLSVMKTRYATWVKAVQHRPMQIRVIGATMSYVFVILALVFVIIPAAMAHLPVTRSKALSLSEWMHMIKCALRWGVVSGLAIYGVFNATNYGIFSDYPWQMAVVDTVWGGILFGTVTLIALFSGRTKW